MYVCSYIIAYCIEFQFYNCVTVDSIHVAVVDVVVSFFHFFILQLLFNINFIYIFLLSNMNLKICTNNYSSVQFLYLFTQFFFLSKTLRYFLYLAVTATLCVFYYLFIYFFLYFVVFAVYLSTSVCCKLLVKGVYQRFWETIIQQIIY